MVRLIYVKSLQDGARKRGENKNPLIITNPVAIGGWVLTLKGKIAKNCYNNLQEEEEKKSKVKLRAQELFPNF